MLRVQGVLSAEDLAEAAKAELEARTSKRILAVRDVLLRGSCLQVAKSFAVSDRTVQRWVSAYNQGGLEALRDSPRPGKPKKLSSELEEKFRQRILAGPLPEEGLSAYRGLDALKILSEEFASPYSLSGVYVVLHRVGLSSLMPRPEHPSGDPEARKTFKKTSRDPSGGGLRAPR